MVRKEGFKRTSFRHCPEDQSTYSVESAVAQNRLSSSSLLKLGIFFFMSGINVRFVPIHVTSRYHPKSVPPNRERDEQPPISARLTECVVTLLALGMAHIAANHQRFVKEDVLSLLRCHLMPFPVLPDIGFIPVESGAVLQWVRGRHSSSIRLSYTCRSAVQRGEPRPSTQPHLGSRGVHPRFTDHPHAAWLESFVRGYRKSVLRRRAEI